VFAYAAEAGASGADKMMTGQVQQLFTSSIRAAVAAEDDQSADSAVQQLMQDWTRLDDDEDNSCDRRARDCCVSTFFLVQLINQHALV